MIDYSITIGNILQILTLAGGGIYVLVRQTVMFKVMETELETMQKEISKIAIIVTDNAVMQQRMLNIEEDIRDIKKGRGFINNEVSGEYGRFGKVIPDTNLSNKNKND